MADAPPTEIGHPVPDPDGPAVEQHVTLDGEPDEVWELLTDPDLVGHWLGRPLDLDLAEGDEGHLVDVDGTERHVRVVEREPGRRLRWTWWPVDDEGAASTVEITLEPASPGTDVHVIEMRARRAATLGSPGTMRASLWRPTSFVDLELALVASRSLVVSATA